MRFKTAFRSALAATLVASLAAGCAQLPVGMQAPAAMGEDGFDALSRPVNQEAIALARGWQRDAMQVGVMINRSPKGVQDAATYVFSSRRAPERMLIVIASNGGVQAQELAVNDNAAQGLANSSPITEKFGELVSSKKIFKKADAAGLKGAEDMVVVNTKIEGKTLPVAIVTDEAGANYMVLNAVNGEPLTGVEKLGARKVQMHILIIGGVVLAVAVGAAVWWAVKKWRKGDKPQPTPSHDPHPGPVPTATPMPTPVPSSKPAGPVSQLIVGPWGEMFERLDSDRDGLLTITEYLKPAKDAATERVKTNEWSEFIDVRHTGKVNRDGFLSGIERSLGSLAAMSFNMLDSNQDGGLDASEAANAVPAAEFQAADTNRDGKLSAAEYLVPFIKKEALYAPHYK